MPDTAESAQRQPSRPQKACENGGFVVARKLFQIGTDGFDGMQTAAERR